MNLDSCDTCGVVIDIDYVGFVDDRLEDGTINPKVLGNRDHLFKTWKCPVCDQLNASNMEID